MLSELVDWIISRVNSLGASPALVLGGNVKQGFRDQNAPVRCHTMLDNGGPADFDLPYRRDMMLQVYTRGETIEQAQADAWEIYSAIHGTSGWRIGPLVSGGQAYKIFSISAMAMPQYIGEGEKGGFEYSTNYLLRASPI